MIHEAYISCISYYLPLKRVTNQDIAQKFPEWSVEKVANKIGIHERRISAPEEFASDMAISSVEKLFIEHNIAADSIDFILLCTQSPDYLLPTTACIVQEKLNIPTKAGALDFNLGCSGYVYGLALAKGLITAGIAKNIVLITSETYSKHIHEMDKSNLTIFGDAASATLISTQGSFLINNFELGTDGRGAENLIVKNGGVRFAKDQQEAKEDEFGNRFSDNHLYMNGSEIFNFTSEAVPSLVNDTLKKNNLSIDEIDYFVFHQANRYMLNHLRKKIGIEENKFIYHLEFCGNTVSSTIPIALAEMVKTGNIELESKVLLAGFGVGYSWGGCVLTKK